MTNVKFSKAETTAITAALAGLNRDEPLDVLAKVSGIIGDKRTTLDNAKSLVAETFGFKATSAEGRVMTYALALGKTADTYIAAVKDAAPKTRGNWGALMGRLIQQTETGVDMKRAVENVIAEYAKASAYEVAHNRMASLADQAQKVLKELRAAAKEEKRDLENLEALEEAIATFTAAAPAKLK